MKNVACALFALLTVAACGDNEGFVDAGPRPDGRRIDGAMTPDAMIDAAGSTVMVETGACPNTPDFSLRTVAGPAFAEVGGGPDNPNITIAAGGTIQFFTNSNHNFASAPGTPVQFQFRSGAIGPHTACLTFTVATPNPLTYLCEAHPSTMTGSLDVN